MAKKKAKKKVVAKKKITAKKKAAPKKKAAAKRPATASKKRTPSKKRASSKARARGQASNVEVFRAGAGRRGLGSEAGGQSGDLQGISRRESADSESVEELLEEGQSLEAEAVSGVEDALDPDESEVTTREVPEDEIASEDGEE
jgi:hypothetical protein